MFFKLQGSPGEPVLAGDNLYRAVIALTVAISVGVSRSEVLSANFALRAVCIGVGLMRNAAGLLTILAKNAVLGISHVVDTGARIAFYANGAIGFESYVLSAFDSSAALSTNCAVFLGRNVLANFSFEATYVAVRITVVRVGMLGIGNAFAAVFANGAIRFQSLVAVAGTLEVTTLVVAGYVVFIREKVRRRARCAAFAITGIVTLIGVSMAECCFADLGCFARCSAFAADLMKDFIIKACCSRLGYPSIAEVMGDCSGEIATFAVTIRVAVVIKGVIQSLIAFSGFLCVALCANSVFNLRIGAVSLGLGFPIAEEVINRSYVVTSLAVAGGVARTVEEMLNVLSDIGAILIVAGGIAFEGECMSTDGIAFLRFGHFTICASANLYLSLEAVSGREGFPIAEYMHCIGDICAANPANRTIRYRGKVAGAISVVSATVTDKVGNFIVGMRCDALKSASLNVTNRIAVIVINMLGYTNKGATLAVTSGVTSVIVKVIKSRNVTVSGFFCFTNNAESVLNLDIGAVCGDLGNPIAKAVSDNSYIIAILTVASGIASMIKGVSENCFSVCLVFISANVAESVKNFSRGAGCGHQSSKFIDVSMSGFSLVIALCAVASGVAIMVENVTECGSTLNCFFNAAESTKSCNYFCGIAVCRSFGLPIGEVVNVITNGLAVVTIGIASIVINMLGNNAGRAANVTIGIARVIVHVIFCNSKLTANVAIRIASGRILVVGNHSKLAANIASGVAIVGVHVCRRNSGSGTNITSLVAIVGVHVGGYSERAAEVTVGIAVVAVNVLGSLSHFAASVTIGVAGAVVDMSLEIRALCTADIALYRASTLVSVCNGCSYFAASITLGVTAVSKCVFGFGLACYAVTFVTGRIARSGVHMVFAEAARKRKQHQHQCQGTKQ